VEDLRSKLDTINTYDKLGLKELFRLSLSGQNISTDSTGNMGLIDMARKSGSKLVYKFEEVNKTYSYYTLTVKVEGQLF
jgi:ACT domain-containing protein